eukprot:gene14791-17485_t
MQSPMIQGKPMDMSPETIIMSTATAYRKSQALYCVVKYDVPNHIGEEPTCVREVAKKVGVNGDALFRIMRALSSFGIFTEMEGGMFTHTPASRILKDPNGMVNGVNLACNPIIFKMWANLDETMKEGTAQGYQCTGEPNFWQYMQKNKDIQITFKKTMGSFGQVFQHTVLKEIMPEFAQFNRVVDVGGSHGMILREILKCNPTIQEGICFDLPHVLGNVPCPDQRYKEVGGSFFECVPDADCYVVKFILHDWKDSSCVEILKNIAKSMKPNGKIYVFDNVITSMNDPNSTVLLDIQMMHLFDGKERTREDFNKMATDSGLVVDKFKTYPNQMGMIVMSKPTTQ